MCNFVCIVLPLLLLPLLLGRQGLLTAWVIYLYPLDAVIRRVRQQWTQTSPKVWEKFCKNLDRLETKFLCSSTANLMNQVNDHREIDDGNASKLKMCLIVSDPVFYTG